MSVESSPTGMLARGPSVKPSTPVFLKEPKREQSREPFVHVIGCNEIVAEVSVDFDAAVRSWLAPLFGDTGICKHSDQVVHRDDTDRAALFVENQQAMNTMIEHHPCEIR